jgi:poly(hydroxyalkanoate) granule-associated protein
MKNLMNNASTVVREKGRTLYLAGLGVAFTVTDQYAKAFNVLVDKGRDATEKKSEMGDEGQSKTILKTKQWGRKFQNGFQSGITRTLSSLGIPSQKEIRDLTNSIEALTQKVQGMTAEKAA